MTTTLDRITEILRRFDVPDDQISASASFVEDMGLDSLDHVELLQELEREFGVEIPDERAEDFKTVGAAAEGVDALVQLASDAPPPPDPYVTALALVKDKRLALGPHDVETGLIVRMVDEITFWRNDAIARLAMTTTTHDSIVNQDQRASIRVAHIFPTIAALESAMAGDLFPNCEACGLAIIPGQPVILAGEIGDIHADCDDHYHFKAGDEIPVDVEALSPEYLEELEAKGEPVPTNPSVRVYLAQEVFTPERADEILAKAKAIRDGD